MRTVKAAVIGTGFIGPAHVEALGRLANVEVVALCGRNPERTEKKAAALPPKLTVPMILFFLPVLFVVILGPAAIKVMAVPQ